jgi:hypothetical protein
MSGWTALPPLAAFLATALLLSVPAIRAFVLHEEAWAQAGFALYFFFVPACIGFAAIAAVAAGAGHVLGEGPPATALSVGSSGLIALATLGLAVLFGLFR